MRDTIESLEKIYKDDVIEAMLLKRREEFFVEKNNVSGGAPAIPETVLVIREDRFDGIVDTALYNSSYDAIVSIIND